MKSLLILLASAGLLIAAPASKTWDGLGKLKSGDPVEVVTSSGSARGQFVANSTESLTVRTSHGEEKFLRPEVVRVVSRTQARRLRNVLIGVGAGAAAGLIADQTLGTYLRNESNPDNARALIWGLPIAVGGGIGAAFSSYPVIYRK